MSACIREVERRGMPEVGIYRVSGSASDLTRLKKAFETSESEIQQPKFRMKPDLTILCSRFPFADNYEAEQLLKDVDIHSVTGIFKCYLRELPETLFTDLLYRRLIETFNKLSNLKESELSNALLQIYNDVPATNKTSINFILDHLLK